MTIIPQDFPDRISLDEERKRAPSEGLFLRRFSPGSGLVRIRDLRIGFVLEDAALDVLDGYRAFPDTDVDSVGCPIVLR